MQDQEHSRTSTNRAVASNTGNGSKGFSAPVQRTAAVRSMDVQWDLDNRPGFNICTSAEFYDNDRYDAEDADVWQYTTGNHKYWTWNEAGGGYDLDDEGTNNGTWEDWSRETAGNSYQDDRAMVIDRAGWDNDDVEDGDYLEWNITAEQFIYDNTDNTIIAQAAQQAGGIDGEVPLGAAAFTRPAAVDGEITRQAVVGPALGGAIPADV